MMQTTVKKDALLQIVRENRAKHRQVFEAALEGYRQEAQHELEDNLKMLAAGRAPAIKINPIRPQDHTRDYDQIIRMLELSVDDTFELDDVTFGMFVMDDWGWKRQFIATSSAYAADFVETTYGEQD